jgi:hypothetical protein
MYIGFFVICLAGPGYFASVITEEKEQMTLGMLRMAGVSPVSILLGKSTSQVLAAIMLLLAQVPFAVLAVTLGGVSLLQIAAGYCALVAHMVLVSNLALLCSTICTRTSTAAKWTTALLLLFFFGPLLTQAILDNMAKGGMLVIAIEKGPLDWVSNASAFNRLAMVMQTGFSSSAIGFQVLSNLALGLVLFLASWAVFDRCSREQKAPAPSRGFAPTRRSVLRWLGVGRAWPNALAWKDFYFATGGKGTMLVKFLAFGGLLGGLALFRYVSGSAIDLDGFGSMTMGTMLLLMFIEAVLNMSRVFAGERKWHSLSGIVLLPVSTRRLAYSKVLGCMLGLAPAVTWFIIGITLNPKGFFNALYEMLRSPAPVIYAVAHVLLFLHLVAWFSLRLRRGALVVAFFIWIVSALFLLEPIALFFTFLMMHTWGSVEASHLILSLILLSVTAVLHFATLRRIEQLAGVE